VTGTVTALFTALQTPTLNMFLSTTTPQTREAIIPYASISSIVSFLHDGVGVYLNVCACIYLVYLYCTRPPNAQNSGQDYALVVQDMSVINAHTRHMASSSTSCRYIRQNHHLISHVVVHLPLAPSPRRNYLSYFFFFRLFCLSAFAFSAVHHSMIDRSRTTWNWGLAPHWSICMHT
jgi:hypothetical protein